MILKQKKLFFSKLIIALDDNYFDEFVAKRAYQEHSFVVALSYRDLTLTDFDRLVKKTALIDLSTTLSEIFAGFNNTTRNEIRKTEKNNRLVFKIEDDNYEELYNLYKKFEFEQGRVPISFIEFREYPIFAAYLDDEPISAVSVFSGGKYVRIRSIFSKRLAVDDKEIYKIISNASRRVIWDVCKWAKEQGFSFLDMASVNLNNPKTASIARFKMNFGGKLIKEYTYLHKSKTFRFFEKLVAIKHFFKRISAHF